MQKNTKKAKNRTNPPNIVQKSTQNRLDASSKNNRSQKKFGTPNPKVAEPKSSSDKFVQSSFGEEIEDFAKVNFLTVSDMADGQRLDNFLLSRLKGLPKSHLYKLIRDGEIRLNKKRVKPHIRLNVGDVVRLAPIRLSTPEQVVVGDELQQVLLGAIVYEDEGLIVLNKPAGMAVHGGSGESVGVIEAMRVATGKKYLELVHRIDKGTSGLLMIAKKRSTLKALQDALREKTLQKTYLAIVAGHLNQDEQWIDKPLLKYTLPSGERRVKIDKEGKPSQTKVAVVARFVLHGAPVSLIFALPKTGRTHQIRVHMASIGHPLLGDDKYHQNDQSAVRRLCLHAYRLEVVGMGKFCAPLADELGALLPGEILNKLRDSVSAST